MVLYVYKPYGINLQEAYTLHTVSNSTPTTSAVINVVRIAPVHENENISITFESWNNSFINNGSTKREGIYTCVLS